MATDVLAPQLNTDPLLAAVPEHEGYKVLGGVVLYQKIGQGGMGAVYRGAHTRLEVDVALKVLAPPGGISATQADNYIKRFLREAKTAAAVKHQNLIRVYDVNSESGANYIIMDYVDGETATQRLARKGKLSEREAVEIALGAAEGLAAAHEAGIVHRDVKPDNILIDKKGNVVIADLGLAKAYAASDTDSNLSMNLSQTSQTLGTPFYMSPEQTESAKSVAPATDVWALGVTLYQLIAGDVPYKDTDVFALVGMIRNNPTPAISGVDVSDGLKAIINKAMSKKVEGRYADCSEFTCELKRHLAKLIDDPADFGNTILADVDAGSMNLAMAAISAPKSELLSLISVSLVKANDARDSRRLAARAKAEIESAQAPNLAEDQAPPPTGSAEEIAAIDVIIEQQLDVEASLAAFKDTYLDVLPGVLVEVEKDMRIAKTVIHSDPAAAVRRYQKAALQLEELTRRERKKLEEAESEARKRHEAQEQREELERIENEKKAEQERIKRAKLAEEKRIRQEQLAKEKMRKEKEIQKNDLKRKAKELLTLAREQVDGLETKFGVDAESVIKEFRSEDILLAEKIESTTFDEALYHEICTSIDEFSNRVLDAHKHYRKQKIASNLSAAKKILPIAIVLLILAFTGPMLYSHVQYNSLMTKATALVKKGQWGDAASTYKEALGHKPKAADALAGFKKANQKNEAELAYAKAMTEASEYCQQKQWDKAASAYTSALEINPNEEKAIAGLKEANRQKEIWRATEYKKAMAEGLRLRAEGKLKAAVAAYKRAGSYAIEGNTDVPKAITECLVADLKAQAIAAEAKGDIDKSVELYTAALAKLDDADIHLRLEQAKLKQDAQAAAARWRRHAQAAEREGDLETALRSYREALKSGAKVEAKVAELDKKLTAIRNEAAYKEAMRKAAEYEQKEQWKGAVGSYRLALKYKPGEPRALQKLHEASKHLTLAKELTLELDDGTKIKFALIPAGKFRMGGNDSDTKPKHTVEMSRPFYMGIYEVTQAQYKAVMSENPSCFLGINHPVEMVSWRDAVEFCDNMALQTGRIVRLPTEAEWEYACRAGTTGEHYGSISKIAWYKYNSMETTRAVGQKRPNAWGLYDCSGNVWEWCSDWYGKRYYANSSPKDPTGPVHGKYHALRGGSWQSSTSACSSANRPDFTPTKSSNTYGFRVVVEIN